MIFDQVLFTKENGVKSEQTFLVVITISGSTHQNIFSAELNNDFEIGTGTNLVLFRFEPFQQRISFNFRLFGDDIAEGREGFQLSLTQQRDSPQFLRPMVLSPNTLIIIEDFDGK